MTKWGGRPHRRLRDQILRSDVDTCSLCGQFVDKTLPGTHPRGPSIDHRLPQSRGGGHELSNLALAHMACNSRKKDRLAMRPRRRSRQW